MVKSEVGRMKTITLENSFKVSASDSYFSILFSSQKNFLGVIDFYLLTLFDLVSELC